MKLVNIGFGNLLNVQRIVAVVSPESAPVKRLIQNAKEEGKLVDLTQGRRTQAVIFTDSEHCFLSYLKTETLGERIAELEDIGNSTEE